MISPLNPTYCVIPQHGQQSVSNLIGRFFTIVNYVAGIVLADEIPILGMSPWAYSINLYGSGNCGFLILAYFFEKWAIPSLFFFIIVFSIHN